MQKYSVVVSNVGEVYTGNNRRQANRDFSESVRLSKNSPGRFAGETVTLFERGEPVREYMPQPKQFWFIEFTDTYGGEANYSWATRFKVESKTEKYAIAKAKREMFNGRTRHDTESYGDMTKIKMRKMCIVAFVTAWDDDSHAHYLNVTEI